MGMLLSHIDENIRNPDLMCEKKISILSIMYIYAEITACQTNNNSKWCQNYIIIC